MSNDLRSCVASAVASVCRPHPDCEPVPDELAIVEAVMEIFEPSIPPTPGVEVRRAIEALGVPQVRFAKALGVSTKHLNQVISGKSALSYELAISLDLLTGIPASWWNAVEAAYRTAQLRAVRKSWRGSMPTREP